MRNVRINPLAIQEFILFMPMRSKKQKQQLLDEARKMQSVSRSMVKAGVRYAALSHHREAAALFFDKKQFDLAAEQYLQAGQKKSAAICYASSDRTEQAIALYEEIGDEDSYLEVISLLRSRMHKGYRYDQNQIRACYETAEFHYRKKQYNKALTRYICVNDSDGVVKSALPC